MKKVKLSLSRIRTMMREKIKSGVKTTVAIKQVADELGVKPGSVHHYYYRGGTPKVKRVKRQSNILSVPITQMYIQDNTLFITFEDIAKLNIK